MRTHDAEHRFAAADPAADLDLTASLDAVWRRIDALAPAPPRRRPKALRLVLVASVAAVIAAAMALLPATERRDGTAGIPAPVQAFADELTGPGVLHVVTERTGALDDFGNLRPLRRLRTEGWYALDGSAWRTRLIGARPGFSEHVFDGRAIRVFDSVCGLVQVTSPLQSAPPGVRAPARLLDLHRELTAGDARVLGRTTVGGDPAYEVGYDLVPDVPPTLDGYLYVAADQPRLLRIDELRAPYDGERVWERSEVPTFDVLPPSARAAELLLPSPRFRAVPQPVCR